MRKLSRQHGLRWGPLATQAGLVLVAIFVLLPVWGLARMALDGAIKGAPAEFRFWPEQWTLDVFRQVWQNPSQTLSVPQLLGNSLIAAGGAALASLGLGASMAYAFARFRFPGRQAGLFGLLVGALLPPVALMTPLYILLSALHLRTSLLGLAIVYAAFSMPFCVWNMRSAFQAVPRELEEAAFLDGAGALSTFWRVTLPLALPALAVAALIAFLIGYTEFAIGWLFVESGDNVTLAMAVSGMSGQTGAWSKQAALALMMSVPVVALFFVLQRYLLRGLLIGVAGE
jgi:arabinogalactan oligomer/maltooligosaccharide transport system permease protein